MVMSLLTHTGPALILSPSEEADLAKHVCEMALYGYGYTRFHLRELATDMCIYLKRKEDDGKLLSEHWLSGFMSRNPTLKLSTPRPLNILRAKHANQETVDAYFDELNNILHKYDLFRNLHSIFNVDETGLSLEHKPPRIIGVTSSRSTTTT